MTDGKKLDVKIVKKSWDVTAEVYTKACEEVGYSNQDIRYQFTHQKITLKEAHRKRDELDEVYRRLLCELPTSELTVLIKAWESEQQNRNPKTIDSVVTELLERELNESKKTD